MNEKYAISRGFWLLKNKKIEKTLNLKLGFAEKFEFKCSVSR
jgi:selenocysteine-specific translation elongation factor